MGRAVERAAVIPVVVSFVVAVACSPAGAHAVLASSSPKDKAVLSAAPKQVVLRFKSRIEKSVTQVTLLNGKGKKVALPVPKNGYAAGPPEQVTIPMPALKPDSYRLEYQVLATDGHLTPGLVRFTIKGKSP